MLRWLCLMCLMCLVACGGGEDEENNASENNCQARPACASGEVMASGPCEGCVERMDGCGGTFYCQADPSCDKPCPDGEFEVVGDCGNPDQCATRIACGQEVVCEDQSACLLTSSCPDGGFPLEACPPDSMGCLPFQVCGTTKYCPTLTDCERNACDPGETPTTQSCAEASMGLPCRSVDTCVSGAVSCVCASEELECEDDEDFDTSPCTPGQICREVRGCGQVFYCKGGSI